MRHQSTLLLFQVTYVHTYVVVFWLTFRLFRVLLKDRYTTSYRGASSRVHPPYFFLPALRYSKTHVRQLILVFVVAFCQAGRFYEVVFESAQLGIVLFRQVPTIQPDIPVCAVAAVT